VDQWELTKYVVGAMANPPKKPSNPPKKGMVMATNVVKAAEVDTQFNQWGYQCCQT